MNALQATGPQRISNAYMQRQLVNAVILLGHQLGSHNGHTGIFNLMLTRQLDFVLRAIGSTGIKGKPLSLHGAGYLLATKGLAIKIYRRFLEHGKADNGSQGLIALGSSNHGHLLLNDTGLLHSNALHSGATAVRVVKSHVGNNAHHGSNHISGVPQATHTHLDHCVINLVQIKVEKGRSGENFKLGGLLADALFYNAIRGHLHRANNHGKIIIADILAI